MDTSRRYTTPQAVRAGGNVSAFDTRYGHFAALHYAAVRDALRAIEVLSVCGATLDLANNAGVTADCGTPRERSRRCPCAAALDLANNAGVTADVTPHMYTNMGLRDAPRAIEALSVCGAALDIANNAGGAKALVGAGAAVDSVTLEGGAGPCVGSARAAKALLGAGAAVDAVTLEGGYVTVCRCSVAGRSARAAKALLGAGAAVNAVTLEGETPLHRAAAFGRVE
ncbi:hypothetical protein T484DRAFT_1808688, partial [Baffinella frigidus]